MASLYCQELIRNSKTLCENYIGEILAKADKKLDHGGGGEEGANINKDTVENLQQKLGENYYFEDDRKLLDILIKNCHPILGDLLDQIDKFNSYNEVFSLKESQRVRNLDIVTEADQNLMDLLQNKPQFSIERETSKYVGRFKEFTEQQKELGIDNSQIIKKSGSQRNIALGVDEEVGGRPSITKVRSSRENNFQKEFVDEAAPQKDSAVKNENKEDQVYYQRRDEASLISNQTYGGAQPQNTGGYFKLRTNVQTVLATECEDDWIFNLNIGNVMHLQPLSTEEMNLHVDNSHELSRDAMLEKIILLTVSYFCVGTELRFLTNQQPETTHSRYGT